MPSLENFGQKQDLVSAFSSLKLLNQFGKHLEIGKAFEAVLGPAQFEQSHPAAYLARHSSHFSSAPTRPSVCQRTPRVPKSQRRPCSPA
jgi:hypothetical protein